MTTDVDVVEVLYNPETIVSVEESVVSVITDNQDVTVISVIQQGPEGGSGFLAGAALRSASLAQFSTTSSAELASILSDNTGEGQSVFSNNPSLLNPRVGTQPLTDDSDKAASTAFVKQTIRRTAYSSGVIIAVDNLDTTPLAFGSAVYSDNGGVRLALASSSTSAALYGLISQEAIAVGETGDMILTGILEGTVSQWAYLTGEAAGLVEGASYFLSPGSPGKYTRFAPVHIQGETLWSVKIGSAISSTKMKVTIFHQTVKL